jgi:DNA-binding SARP family transcriptional activator
VTLTIRLLGRPVVERDGQAVPPPRGRKTWALLAYLVLAERPQGRRHLAELLFADADDPLGALRWTLAELRRALGAPGLFGGDPVDAALGPDVRLDLDALTGAALDALTGAAEPEALLGLGGELLDGLTLTPGAAFESWLVVERHRLAGLHEARLHEAALRLLAAGRAKAAVAYAARAVARNPLDETNHELLVRCLAASGDTASALRQVAVAEDTLRRELGVELSAAVRDAASAPTGSAAGLPVSGRAAVASQLDAGKAAIAAGAVQAGIDCLRRAVAEAAGCNEPGLEAGALVALGGALVHAVRGRDEEGALVLHEAIQLAETAGERAAAVTAMRELGFVDVQAGRRETAAGWLDRAAKLAEGDLELAPILGVRAMNASDMADYPAALALFDESIGRANAGGDQRQEAFSLGLLARVHLLRDERAQAALTAQRSIELVNRQRWLAFLPWPESLGAEVALRTGDVEGAAEQLEHAWMLACQLGDPCWEGMAARGLGLLHTARGDRATGSAWLTEASARCTRVADRYQWISGHILDTRISDAIDRGDEAVARRLAGELHTLAARTGMRELVVRAKLHQGRLGDTGALAAGRLLAEGIDNPALTPLLEQTFDSPARV